MEVIKFMAENKDNLYINEKLINNCKVINDNLEESLLLLLNKDRIRNNDVIVFINKIDYLKQELNNLKIEVIKEYLE